MIQISEIEPKKMNHPIRMCSILNYFVPSGCAGKMMYLKNIFVYIKLLLYTIVHVSVKLDL